MDGGEASQPISDFDSIEAPAAGTMTVPTPKKPLLISFVQLVLYASIVLCIVVIVRNLLSLFGSTMSPDGLLSLLLSTLGVGLITGCLWLLHLAVEARLRIARVGLAVLVLVASGFLILGSDDGGPRYQERVRNWESGNSLVDPFSPEYAAGIVCGKLTRGIIAVAITLGLLFGRKSKEYLTNSLSERERSRPQTEWRFELQWMLASSIGWAVGFFMVQVVRRAAISIMSYVLSFALGFLDAQFDRTQASGMPAEFIFVGEAVVQTAVGAVLGGVIGITQWLILRQWIYQAGRWALASTAGVSLSFFTLVVIGTLGESALEGVDTLVWGGVIGAVTGTMQWFVLRRQVARAGWWVLVSIVSWAVSQAVGAYVQSGAALGIVYGIIAGTALVWLLRHPASETPS